MKKLNEIKFSVLDLAAITQGKTIKDSFDNSLTLARHAEKLGYTRFWMAEHHNIAGVASAATSVLLGHIAQGTSTIRVGSGGVMLPNHAPLVIAEQFGTLAILYPNRIDLGLGRAPGTDQATMHALRRDSRSSQQFPEQVAELMQYLEPAGAGQKIKAIPGAGTKVPIYLLGSSLFSAQLAAEMGLPYAFAGHFAPQDMLDAIRLYRSDFRPNSKLDKPYVMVGVQAVVAEEEDQAQYLATSLFQKFANFIRGNHIGTPPPVKNMDELWNPAEKEYLASMFRYMIVSGRKELKEKIEALVKITKADELIISSDVYAIDDKLKSYEIISQVMQES